MKIRAIILLSLFFAILGFSLAISSSIIPASAHQSQRVKMGKLDIQNIDKKFFK